MKKRNVLASGIVIMALGVAMGCGSRENLGERSSSTYNVVKSISEQTKSPTIIVPQTIAPKKEVKKTATPKTAEPKKEAVTTKSPKPTTTPAIEKKKTVTTEAPKKTVKPTKTSTPTKMATKSGQKKRTSKKEPAKKKAIKSTPTPAPAMTQEPVKKSVSNIKSMKGVLTTIGLYVAEGQSYDPQDEECYYSIMYMLAGNEGYRLGKNEYKEKDGQIFIGRDAMQALSAAAFADHKVIGEVAKAYRDMISYDKDDKTYMLYASDAGDVAGKIQKAEDNGNGTYSVYFNLTTGDGKEVLSSLKFTLVENQSKYASVRPNFYYRVKSVKKLTE